MKVTFLGTGTSQGVPVIACQCRACLSNDNWDKRLRSSILIEEGDTKVVIDTGPDFRQQMLREDVRKLSALLFTHGHRDHIAGLDDVRSFNWLTKSPMDVFAEELVLESFRTSFPYIFAENRYPGVPDIKLHMINTEKFFIEALEFIPIRMHHYKMPVLGYRIKDFAYLIDANYLPDDQKHKLFGLKHLVIGALRREKHISHFSVSEAIKIIEELKPESAYLTHISHQLGLQAEFRTELPAYIFPAHDQLVLEM